MWILTGIRNHGLTLLTLRTSKNNRHRNIWVQSQVLTLFADFFRVAQQRLASRDNRVLVAADIGLRAPALVDAGFAVCLRIAAHLAFIISEMLLRLAVLMVLRPRALAGCALSAATLRIAASPRALGE